MYPSISAVPVRPHKVSVYLPPAVLLGELPAIAARGCDELWLNPGTESDEVLAEAARLGLNVVQACSIIGVGGSTATVTAAMDSPTDVPGTTHAAAKDNARHWKDDSRCL